MKKYASIGIGIGIFCLKPIPILVSMACQGKIPIQIPIPLKNTDTNGGNRLWVKFPLKRVFPTAAVCVGKTTSKIQMDLKNEDDIFHFAVFFQTVFKHNSIRYCLKA